MTLEHSNEDWELRCFETHSLRIANKSRNSRNLSRLIEWRAFLIVSWHWAAIGTVSFNHFDHWFSLLVTDCTFCMIKIIWFQFFFWLILSWSLFSHCLMVLFYIHIYINFISCHVQCMVCTPESECHCECEHWTLTGGTLLCGGAPRWGRRAARKKRLFVFLFHSFSFLYCNKCFTLILDLMLVVEWKHGRKFRGAFLVCCVFFFSLLLSFVFSVSFKGELNFYVNENMLWIEHICCD